MSKVRFFYSVMGAGKSLHLLQAYHNLTSNGFNAIILKPELEDRFGKNIVKSRIGVSQEAISISDNTDFEKLVESYGDLKAIFVDETQFLSSYSVQELINLSDFYNIDIFFYGLRTNFKGKLFSESIVTLMELADSIEEIKSICGCGNKAILHLRYDKKTNTPIRDGDIVVLGLEDTYKSVCRKCWNSA